MLRYENYEYVRPDYEKIQKKMDELLEKLKNSTSVGEALHYAMDVDQLRDEYGTMQTLCGIRYAQNTNDPFYCAENEYFDQYSPLFAGLNAKFYQVLLELPWQKELADFYGEQFLRKADARRRVNHPDIVPDKQEEAKLVSLNSRLTSGAMVEFDGKQLTLSQLSGYLAHEDREVRKKASAAYYGYFHSIAPKTDAYYDQMVKIRHGIAQKMGFKDYEQMSYLRMGRTDYHADDVAAFREQVRIHLVPLNTRLIERQKKRLGLDRLPYYDESIRFLSGNPRPHGTVEEILKAGEEMYEKLSPETGEFFHFMEDRGLIDVISRTGKDGGAFSSYISGFGAPFLYANFNGTLSDVNVLTHEAGHAFQSYMSRNLTPAERAHATVEASEVHSTSMELFTLPYMETFFGKDADKYRYVQIEKALQLITYACTVDEFQHLVYTNPDATPEQRYEMWRTTEKKYIPYRDYEDCAFLEKGGWWHRQGHIFSSPFYYIDYALAQVCALGFLMQMDEDYPTAWGNYLKLCKLGGTLPFQKLLKEAGVRSPFAQDTVERIAAFSEKYLSQFDDMNM